MTTLTVPCWDCAAREAWRLDFRTDLNVLAPLGDGTGNAARWLAFRRLPPIDPSDYEMRRFGDREKPLLKPGSQLLREAEPWADQATMRFYPDIYWLDGWRTELPNLLFARLVARSWIARGHAQSSPQLALQDFRRAVRLGRLLRQEDVFVSADLAGLSCIEDGAQAIYDLAEQRADRRLAQAAAIVLGEVAPQRLRTAERLTRIDLKAPEDDRLPGDGWPLSRAAAQALSPRQLEVLIAAARSDPDRRFRIEAVLQLNVVRSLGTSHMRQQARAALAALATGREPILAQFAAWGRDTDITPLL